MGNCFCKKLNLEKQSNQVFSFDKEKLLPNIDIIEENSYTKFFQINKYKEINKIGVHHFSIPNDPYERLKWVYKFYKSNTIVGEYIKKAPKRTDSNLDMLIEYLKSYPSKDILTKYFMIYLWITSNISLDANNIKNSTSEISVEDIYNTGISNRKGYSKLFHKISKSMKLFSICIPGLVKTNFQNDLIEAKNMISSQKEISGQDFDEKVIFEESNHEWNVIDISGKFYFVECFLGSGYFNEWDEFTNKFNPLYFLSPAEFFIDNHYPIKSEWQLLEIEISKSKFENNTCLSILENYNELFKRDIQLINEVFPFIYYDSNNKKNYENEISIELTSPKTELVAYLNLKTTLNKDFTHILIDCDKNNIPSELKLQNNFNSKFNFQNLVLIEKDFIINNIKSLFDEVNLNYNNRNDIYNINVVLPFAGVFALSLYEIERTSNDGSEPQFSKAFEYLIQAKNLQATSNIGYPIQYINPSKLNYKLYQPKRYFLEKNSLIHFSISIKEEVCEVLIVQGNQINSLKLQNGMWEESIKIVDEEINLIVNLDDSKNNSIKLFSFHSF